MSKEKSCQYIYQDSDFDQNGNLNLGDTDRNNDNCNSDVEYCNSSGRFGPLRLDVPDVSIPSMTGFGAARRSERKMIARDVLQLRFP